MSLVRCPACKAAMNPRPDGVCTSCGKADPSLASAPGAGKDQAPPPMSTARYLGEIATTSAGLVGGAVAGGLAVALIWLLVRGIALAGCAGIFYGVFRWLEMGLAGKLLLASGLSAAWLLLYFLALELLPRVQAPRLRPARPKETP